MQAAWKSSSGACARGAQAGKLLSSGRPCRRSCQPAILWPLMSRCVLGSLPRGAAAPELGELRSPGGLQLLPSPRYGPARPGPYSSLSYSSSPAESGRGGQSHLLAPFSISPSLIFLGKELIRDLVLYSYIMVGTYYVLDKWTLSLVGGGRLHTDVQSWTQGRPPVHPALLLRSCLSLRSH